MIIPVAKITLWDGTYHYTDNPTQSNVSLLVARAKRRFIGSGRPYNQMAEIKHINIPRAGFNVLVETTPESELFD